jgi:hypothetical protein
MCSKSAIGPISDLQFGVANTEMGVIRAPEPGLRIMRYVLTDFEWTAIKPFLTNKPRGVPRVNDRRIFSGIFRRSDLTNISWIDPVATRALRAILTG